MYPLNAILIGCDEDTLPQTRRELENRSAYIEAEFADVADVVNALRKSPEEKRLLIYHLRGPRGLDQISRLTTTFPGWPVLALLGGGDWADRSREDAIIDVMRAGAAQIVALPLRAYDFKAALDRISAQFVYAVKDTKVIAVAGVVGGCGATTIAINLAYEIALGHDLRCILVDLSLRIGTVATYLNLEPGHTILDLLRDVNRLDIVLAGKVLTKVTPRLDVLAGPHEFAAPIPTSPRDVALVVDTLKQITDVVVLNVPCTYDDVYFETLAGAGQVVLVGEQSIPSIRALKLVHEALGRGGESEYLVLNRFDPKITGFSVERLLKPLGVSELRTVARDESAFRAAVDQGCALRLAAPKSPALNDIVALAETLLARDHPPRAKAVGLLGRLARAFANT